MTYQVPLPGSPDRTAGQSLSRTVRQKTHRQGPPLVDLVQAWCMVRSVHFLGHQPGMDMKAEITKLMLIARLMSRLGVSEMLPEVWL